MDRRLGVGANWIWPPVSRLVMLMLTYLQLVTGQNDGSHASGRANHPRAILIEAALRFALGGQQ
jgi:hypothetical protein